MFLCALPLLQQYIIIYHGVPTSLGVKVVWGKHCVPGSWGGAFSVIPPLPHWYRDFCILFPQLQWALRVMEFPVLSSVSYGFFFLLLPSSSLHHKAGFLWSLTRLPIFLIAPSAVCREEEPVSGFKFPIVSAAPRGSIPPYQPTLHLNSLLQFSLAFILLFEVLCGTCCLHQVSKGSCPIFLGGIFVSLDFRPVLCPVISQLSPEGSRKVIQLQII